MARTVTRRYLRRGRKLEILLPARHVHRCLDHAVAASLAVLSALALLLVVALPVPAHAAGDIRVGLSEGLATVEIGGGPILVQDLNGRALATEPVSFFRALRRESILEWRGQRVAGPLVLAAGGGGPFFPPRGVPRGALR